MNRSFSYLIGSYVFDSNIDCGVNRSIYKNW